eukprot:FR737508.1.p2 GENE.FR737508.1~~FR737508.1.p2  ORF type:complete len:128 (+),score=2.81 FR737508.1:172-555(+)
MCSAHMSDLELLDDMQGMPVLLHLTRRNILLQGNREMLVYLLLRHLYVYIQFCSGVLEGGELRMLRRYIRNLFTQTSRSSGIGVTHDSSMISSPPLSLQLNCIGERGWFYFFRDGGDLFPNARPLGL